MFLPTNITLKFGDAGDFVSELQRRLAVVKCFPDSMVNGFFDGNTAGGVSRFQTMVGIKADGIAGPETLRRLNAALSGDFSGGTSEGSTNQQHAEEADRQRREAEEILRQQQLREQQERDAAIERERQAEIQAQELRRQQQQQQQAAYTPPPPPAPPAYEPPPAAPQAYASSQPQPAPTPMQPSGPSASEMLANMLASTQPPQRSTPSPAEPQPVTPQPYSQPIKQPPQQAYELPAQALQEPSPSRGVVARAVQYANEALGKLAAYFESKLPRHVIEEVKQIGHAMAAGGVREVPIPTGPEQQRERSTEQQRGTQQGRQVG